jgi:hypothetical protein
MVDALNQFGRVNLAVISTFFEIANFRKFEENQRVEKCNHQY